MVFVCFEVVLCFLCFCWILFGVEHKSTHLSFGPQVQRLQLREEVTFFMKVLFAGMPGVVKWDPYWENQTVQMQGNVE